MFVEPTADPATLDGHTFDMRGAEYSHEGDNCTFQVMVSRDRVGHHVGGPRHVKTGTRIDHLQTARRAREPPTIPPR